MVREEITGKRNLDFSGWIRSNLTGIEGYTVFDIDFVYRDYLRKRLQIVEAKVLKGKLTYMQERVIPEIASIFEAGIAAGKPEPGWRWMGYHVVRFENTSPENGLIEWDGKIITREKLIELLEMREG
jgi:hypothetical protein